MRLHVCIVVGLVCSVTAYEARGNVNSIQQPLPPDAKAHLEKRACDGVVPLATDELALVTTGNVDKGAVVLSLGAGEVFWVREGERSPAVEKVTSKSKELARVLKKVPTAWARNRLLLGLVLAHEAQEDASIRQAVNRIQARRFGSGRIGEVLCRGGRSFANYSLGDNQTWCDHEKSWAGVERRMEDLGGKQFSAGRLGELARVWEWIDSAAYTVVDGRKKSKKIGAQSELVKAFSQNREGTAAWFHSALPFICPAGQGGKRGGVAPNVVIVPRDNGSIDVLALKNINAGTVLYASDRIALSQTAIACEGRFTDGNPDAMLPLTSTGFKSFVEADKFRNLGLASFHSAIGKDKGGPSDPLLEWRRGFSFGVDGRPSAKLLEYLRTVLAQQCDEVHLDAIRRGAVASPSNELATTKFLRHIAAHKLEVLGSANDLDASSWDGDGPQLSAAEQSLATALIREQGQIAERAIEIARSDWVKYAQELVDWPDLS